MTRAETKFRLTRDFGLLMGPLHALFNSPSEPSRSTIAMESGKYQRDMTQVYLPQIAEFCTIDSIRLEAYYQPLFNGLYQMVDLLSSTISLDYEIATFRFNNQMQDISNALWKLPADDQGLLIPSQSPFSTYHRILAICQTVEKRIQIFDPYLDSEVFDRYLINIRTGIQMTIITGVKETMRKPRNRSRVVAVSELYALEHPTVYRLLESERIHDRHLRADDKIFHLGNSSKDAAKRTPYTISNLDDIEINHISLDQMIAEATPWFQPGMPHHRKWCAQCDAPTDPVPNQPNFCKACRTTY